jgi:hypothetical protein
MNWIQKLFKEERNLDIEDLVEKYSQRDPEDAEVLAPLRERIKAQNQKKGDEKK